MQEFLPYIVIGLTAGSVYGLAGTGLVLTYKTSGVFNFAYGAIAAVAAYVFYWLHVREGVSWQVAALLCLFVLGPVMGLFLELLTRMLSQVGTQYQIVGTIGLALGIAGVLTLWGNSWSEPGAFVQFPDFLPTETFTRGGRQRGLQPAHHDADRARVGHRAVPVLPMVTSRRLDARGSRQPGPREHRGHESPPRPPLGLGDRDDVCRDGRASARPDRRPQRHGADPVGGAGVWSGGRRLLLELAADLCPAGS